MPPAIAPTHAAIIMLFAVSPKPWSYWYRALSLRSIDPLVVT